MKTAAASYARVYLAKLPRRDALLRVSADENDAAVRLTEVSPVSNEVGELRPGARGRSDKEPVPRPTDLDSSEDRRRSVRRVRVCFARVTPAASRGVFGRRERAGGHVKIQITRPASCNKQLLYANKR